MVRKQTVRAGQLSERLRSHVFIPDQILSFGKIQRWRALIKARARSFPSMLFDKRRAASRAFSGADQTREFGRELRKKMQPQHRILTRVW